jgi:hypothetical protein
MFRRVWTRLGSAAPPATALLTTTFSTRGAPAFCGTAEEEVRAKHERLRQAQYAGAMTWVRDQDGRTAYGATVLLNEDGSKRFPLISEKSLRMRLSGKVNNEQPFQSHQALTPAEEADLVECCVEMNRFGQGLDRAVVGELVLQALHLRPPSSTRDAATCRLMTRS